MSNNIQKKTRDSNFELLRIISMMMIIGVHYFNGSMGGALSKVNKTDTNYYITYLFMALFIIGVNCFVLITGYYQINIEKIKINKIIKIIAIMLFYSNLFYFISILLGENKFVLKEFIKLQFPFFRDRFWFMKIYIILYLLSPYINCALHKLDIKMYKNLLIILTVFFSLWPSFLPGTPNNDGGYGIITFVYLYSIGGYLRLFKGEKNKSQYKYLLLYIICSLCTFILSINGFYSWGYNYIFNVLGSVALFIFFKSIKLKSKFINIIAESIISVYFIHTNYSIREIIYKKILKCNNYYLEWNFIFHMLSSVILIFSCSVIIDIIFRNILKFILKYKKYLVLIWNKLIDYSILIINNLYYFNDKLMKIILKKPSVLKIDETIEYIINNNCSVSRYGDGELKLMRDNSIFFQEKNEELSRRLKEIISNKLNKHIVCLPDIFGELDAYADEPQSYWKLHIAKTRLTWYKVLNRDKQYYNAFISRCYYMYKDKSKSEEWFKKIKLIWKDRDIVIVEGEKSRLGIGNDLFENTNSIERILCPAKNAFSKYNEILEQVIKVDKNKLILLAIGPTATVLSYDLCKAGYQAIDIGHIDIEYEWFLMGASKKEKVKNKFIGEAPGGTDVGECEDLDYKNQIISKVY